ncbi:hypothetical protein GOV06_02545 [Candidatus Woesearchaeota archaeon]|nr:hypothetical protein [Candidatus Woesearchaeota archaeon]
MENNRCKGMPWWSLPIFGAVFIMGYIHSNIIFQDYSQQKNQNQQKVEVSSKASQNEETKLEYTITKQDSVPTFFGGGRGPKKIYSSPEEKTGISAEIHVGVQDEGGKNPGLAEIVLYEDGKRVPHNFYINKTNCLSSVPVKHEEPGKHTYFVEATDFDGNTTKSDELYIEFTGKLSDLPPEFIRFEVGDKGQLLMMVSDEGDNKGIKTVSVYEEGKLIKEFDGRGESSFLKSMPLTDRITDGKRNKYYAEAVDLGGNRVKSDTLGVTLTEK